MLFNRLAALLESFEPSMDAAHAKAVESGDMFAARRMVDEAAEKAGHSRALYRGDRPGKIKFTGREDSSNYIQGNVFLFDDPRLAKFYTRERANYMRSASSMGKEDGLYSLRANLGKRVLVVDAEEEGWMSIPVPSSLGGVEKYPKGLQIDDLAALTRKKGYTAIEVRDVFDQAGLGSQYAVFSPGQLKSADPATYDDQGGLIPLSKRFDPSMTDIRY